MNYSNDEERWLDCQIDQNTHELLKVEIKKPNEIKPPTDSNGETNLRCIKHSNLFKLYCDYEFILHNKYINWDIINIQLNYKKKYKYFMFYNQLDYDNIVIPPNDYNLDYDEFNKFLDQQMGITFDFTFRNELIPGEDIDEYLNKNSQIKIILTTVNLEDLVMERKIYVGSDYEKIEKKFRNFY